MCASEQSFLSPFRPPDCHVSTDGHTLAHDWYLVKLFVLCTVSGATDHGQQETSEPKEIYGCL